MLDGRRREGGEKKSVFMIFHYIYKEKDDEMPEYTEHEMEQIRFEEHLQDQFERDQERLAAEQNCEDERPEDAANAVWNQNCDSCLQVDEHVEDYRIAELKREILNES